MAKEKTEKKPKKNASFAAYEILPIDSLIAYEKNARTHSAKQIKQIASSIEEFGFTNPILADENKNIIAGHGRCLAAQKLGLTELPAIILEGLTELPAIILEGLTEEQKRALILADNKLALNAGWDDKLLNEELEFLRSVDFNLDLTGFDPTELRDLLAAEEVFEGLTDEDAVPETPELPATVLGDVWQLGNHRLMCGDSTNIDAVEKLMDGNELNLLFTDPPYNVAFNGRSGKHDVIKNDNLTDKEFNDFIDGVIAIIKILNPKIYYIWCNWKFYGILQNTLDYKACIVWAKNVFGLGRNYRHQHEFCLFNGSIDAGINNESDLWNISKDTNYVHPTQKPVELSERAFKNHKKAKNILDLFGGSGSTLIGCEKLNRNCFMMELDPKYCDVIIKRWEQFTGKKAILISENKTFEQITAERLGVDNG